MSTLQEVKDELDQIKAGVDASNTLVVGLKQQIADLQAQVSNGNPVSQADLDALDAKADEIIAAQSGGNSTGDPNA